MKIAKSLAAGLLVALASMHAQAVTIDFEASGTPRNYNALDYSIDGFVFNYTMDNIDISAGSGWAGRGPAHSGRYTGLNNHGGVGEITLLGGGTFSFQDLWLKSWFGTTQRSTVTGFLNGVAVGSITHDTVNNGWFNFAGGVLDSV